MRPRHLGRGIVWAQPILWEAVRKLNLNSEAAMTLVMHIVEIAPGVYGLIDWNLTLHPEYAGSTKPLTFESVEKAQQWCEDFGFAWRLEKNLRQRYNA